MAINKGSRYEHVPRFASSTASVVGSGGFTGTRPRQVTTTAGVLEHRVQAGQRLDLLALHYYNDVRKWWRILDANPHILNAGDFVLDSYEGTTILIPRASDGERS